MRRLIKSTLVRLGLRAARPLEARSAPAETIPVPPEGATPVPAPDATRRLLPGQTLDTVIDANLELVAEAAETAAVAYFVQRGNSLNRHRIGVSDHSRAALLEALTLLADTWLTTGGMLGPTPAAAIADDPDARADFMQAPRWRVFRNWMIPGTSITLGALHGCEVDFWHDDGSGKITDLAYNPLSQELMPTAEARAVVRVGERDHPSFAAFTRVDHVDDITFPIDIVYTWVDDRDPAWRERMTAARAALGRSVSPHAAGEARFRNRDELRYSLRSTFAFAPWYHHIYLVTDDQSPSWLDTAHPDITVVDHRDIFRSEDLPTFNSDAIQARLHHIEGLTEHFIYMNDDIFFGRRVRPDLFFTPNGLWRYYPSRWPIPAGPVTPRDSIIDAASKNVRDAIAARFGRRVTHKIRHTPYALRRSVLLEMETEFPEIFARVAATRFRAHDGMAVACALANYYANLTGRALPGWVPGDLKYEYFDLGTHADVERLASISGTWVKDTICLNDTPGDEADDDAIAAFLTATFPIPAPWERPTWHTGSLG